MAAGSPADGQRLSGGVALVFHRFSLIFIDFHWFSLVFIGFQVGRAGRDTVRGWPPGRPRMARYCLGALLGRLGGSRQEESK